MSCPGFEPYTFPCGIISTCYIFSLFKEANHMRVNWLLFPAILIIMVFVNNTGHTQTIGPVRSSTMIDIAVYFKSLDLAFDAFTQEQPPDSAKMAALKIASGYLTGIPVHYEHSRDKLTIFEQIEKVADEFQYNGYTESDDGIYTFNFTFWVDDDICDNSRTGTYYAGHGVSDLENQVDARSEARMNAFAEAVRSALSGEFTERMEVIPGVVEGRILWYEITRDQVDPENGFYVFDINAWIRFEKDSEQ